MPRGVPPQRRRAGSRRGRSARDVARELGVNHEALRNWVEALHRERRDGPAAVNGEKRAELARLRRHP
ncbi:transposase [Pseudonocardia sp. NPDC049635]|uniref:transposase n=1 Tax=Pseudonocardia sp. NPDC049635 TaxID=3155506 RepID=UPI0034105BC8